MMKYILLAFSIMLVMSIFVINHNYSYANTLNDAPSLTTELSVDPRNIGKTFSVIGQIVSYFQPKKGMYIFKINDAKHNLFIDVVIFPSLGKLAFTPMKGNKINVIGNLAFYKNRPQLKPLSIEHFNLIDMSIDVALVSLKDAIEKTDESLLIGPVSIVNYSKFTSRSKKIHLRFVFRSSNSVVNGIMFANNWDETLVKNIDKDAPYIIDAKVGTYRGQPSLTVNQLFMYQSE